MIKLSQLKQEEVRAIISVTTPDGEEEIVIKNPTPQIKKHILGFMEEVENNNYNSENVLVYLITRLTNIEVDVENVNEILENPSLVLIEILKHLNAIMHEVLLEVMTEQTVALSMVEKTIMGKELSEKMYKLNDTFEKLKKEAELMETKKGE